MLHKIYRMNGGVNYQIINKNIVATFQSIPTWLHAPLDSQSAWSRDMVHGSSTWMKKFIDMD